MVSLISSVFPYILKSTNIILYIVLFFQSSDRWNGNSFGEMRTDNLLLYIKGKKKKSNKLFRRLHSRNTHTHHQCNLFPSTMLLMQIWLFVTCSECFAFIHSYMNWCQKASEAS